MDGSGDLDRGEFETVMTSLATSDWAEAFDEDRGKAYYYNRQTNEVQWHQPDSEAAVEDFMRANGLVLQPLRQPPPLETLRSLLDDLVDRRPKHRRAFKRVRRFKPLYKKPQAVEKMVFDPKTIGSQLDSLIAKMC